MKLTLRLAKNNVFGEYPIRQYGDRKKNDCQGHRHLLATIK